MTRVIGWCATRGIRTLASCQQDGERAYILFATVTDLARFFDLVVDICEVNPGLCERITRTYGAVPLNHWRFEVGPSDETRLGHGRAYLSSVVRMPPDDLVLLDRLITAAVPPASLRIGMRKWMEEAKRKKKKKK